MSNNEQLNQFFDGLINKKCSECKNDTFQVCYNPTPSTPPDLLSVITKCTSCGDTEQIYAEGASSTPPWENKPWYKKKNNNGN